jgi:gluconate 2-dehydrogenase gamma chain
VNPALNRREALRRLAAGGVGLAAAPSWVEALTAHAASHAHAQTRRAAATAWKPKVLSAHQNATVVALSELIIPQTDTAGAKAAKVNEFIDLVLSDAKAEDREKFMSGLAWVDARAKQDFGKTFVAASPQEQTALLTAISKPPEPSPAAPDKASAEKTGPDKTGTDNTGPEFFMAIKSMTITGYYTSEIGMREELGDDGNLFFAEFKGCTHPEHQ